MLTLKNYQQTTLDALRQYLESARFKGAKSAYESMEKAGVPDGMLYKHMPEMEKTPFICLRLPTGGGKTLLSAYTVKIAAEAYLETEYPLVLWLVPTNTIRNQTLETLKKPDHANHEALRTAFDGRFMVFDIADFEQIRPQDLKSKACIIIGTIQTLRVESTDGRKVYAHNENLEPHFTKMPDIPDLERIEDGDNKGKVKFSFRNLLAMHRPLVIVDEAHKIPLPTLVYHRYVLEKIIAEKIKGYRKRAYEAGYQEVLFGKSTAVETSYDYAFSFGASDYPARWYYSGYPYDFQKHFYPQIGELDNKGEEFDCAVALDQQKAVKYWVRNISQSPASFWLPTSTDKFYPDFIAELTDGRILVIEYKGADRISADDAKEKLNLGHLWEEKSKGKALFLMAEKFSSGKNVYQQIENRVR